MSWAYSALRASHEKKGQLIYGVVAYLLKQGAVLFDDEKDNSSQSVKLLMIQMQRIMAEKMVAAPRKQLLRNWVRAMRHAKAWVANPADFEKMVQECIDLGPKEVELQRLGAAMEAEQQAALQSRLFSRAPAAAQPVLWMNMRRFGSVSERPSLASPIRRGA